MSSLTCLPALWGWVGGPYCRQSGAGRVPSGLPAPALPTRHLLPGLPPPAWIAAPPHGPPASRGSPPVLWEASLPPSFPYPQGSPGCFLGGVFFYPPTPGLMACPCLLHSPAHLQLPALPKEASREGESACHHCCSLGWARLGEQQWLDRWVPLPCWLPWDSARSCR